MFAARKRRLSAGASGAHLRTRRGAGLRGSVREEQMLRGVTTVRGQRGAGETETEMDEVASALPIARAPRASSFPLEQQIISYLFEFSRLLSIVPAVFGTLYNLHNIYHPPPNLRHSGIDYVVCTLWAILTGIQCLALTTGLLTRWQAYYPPLSTLIRLLALQAICWPATHLTLSVLNHLKRPVACWVVIGSTTCVSRSVQLWVTSNLWDHVRNAPLRVGVKGKVGERRWDWGEVGVKCVLPAGLLYFVTAWALILKGELHLRGC
ncbi:hypothetical protein BD410DRAFT_725693 [Rickenella mellea]|uniref:N-glycosylation protein EOS1 n=1 Tax=Rickenella mellea TaxID=50990 RepID=A0A4Y7Q0Y0_9AGAM|nr:hypothetical protein BD410DRAFT_725693 [Rickenella mellea]